MRLRQKLIFLALASLCLATVVLAIRHQAATLTTRHHAALRAAYLASTRAELRRHVELALYTVGHLYETGRIDDTVRRQARQALATLEAGTGGYFFVYDQQGQDVLHPLRHGSDAAPSIEMHDAGLAVQDSPVQQLIERADKGGGYVRYAWRGLPDQDSAPRLAYVSSLPRWGWVVGSGVALDQVDTALAGISGELSSDMDRSMALLASVAAMATLVMALPGWMVRLGKRARPGCRTRTQRIMRESRWQWPAVLGLHLQAMLARLHGRPARLPRLPRLPLSCGRPAGPSGSPDTHSLAMALEQLCAQWRSTCGTAAHIRFNHEGDLGQMPATASAILMCIAQQALANIAQQACATEVSLRLHGSTSLVLLQVRDNGSLRSHESNGNAGSARPHPPRQGEHLRAMRTQLESIGGALALDTSSAGTLLSAVVARTPGQASG